jgi:hypothetical protein
LSGEPFASFREITNELQKWSDGEKFVTDELMALVYDELHRQASRYLRQPPR